MKTMYRFYIPVLCCWLLYACSHAAPDARAVHREFRQQLVELSETGITPANQDSLIKIWQGKAREKQIQADTLLLARVYYNLARLYAGQNGDSARRQLELALSLVETQSGGQEEKALVYNGMGNILNAGGHMHQTNYYYSKAAGIVMSDSTLELTPRAKCTMLTAAAQSNGQLRQHHLALDMNRAALALLPALQPDDGFQQRVRTQMIYALANEKAPLDSIAVYLSQLDDLYRRYPGHFNAMFLYECRGMYYEGLGNTDSSIANIKRTLQLALAECAAGPVDRRGIANLYNAYSNLLHAYAQGARRYDSAAVYLRYCDSLERTYPALMDEDRIRLNKDFRLNYYLETGQLRQAAIEGRALADLQKKIFETEHAAAVTEMSALYQLQAKDKYIGNLNENINQSQGKLEYNRFLLLITALGALLLLVLIILLYVVLQQRRQRAATEKAMLQQQLLRTQMEPHFIFNTLSALQSFIRLDEKENAIRYLNQFSRLLRSSLELSREQLVSLADEIEALENYLSLQQMRHGHAFTYTIDQEEDAALEEVLLPPMLIQPFVENAILHGIDYTRRDGWVKVAFRLADAMLTVTITDSGRTELTQAGKAHQSLSGTISRERLELLARQSRRQAGIHLQKLAGGTQVIIHIPVQVPGQQGF